MNRRGELTETSSEDDTPSENPKSSPRRGHQVNHLQAYHYDSHGSSNTKAMPRLNGQIDHFGVGKNIFCPQMSWDKLEAQYEISDVFAEGNFAQVRKATKKSSKVDFAIKVIPKEKVLKRAMIDNEISIMQSYGFQKKSITRWSLRWPKKYSKEMLSSRFRLVDFFSINQNREHNISFEDFLCYLKDPRVP